MDRQRMKAKGIGLAGIEGVWWLPAQEAFALPGRLAGELARIGSALFVLFDTVTALYHGAADEKLQQLLEYKVPRHLRPFSSGAPVESVRPDFQLSLTAEGKYQLMATELEICPSAQGFAHAMQVGYGLATDLVASFARYLNGRELLFVGSSQWSEFLFEQLAFCRALAGVGARGRVLYDQPMTALAESVRRGQWQPPLFGIKEKPAAWNEDVPGRIQAHGFAAFVWPETASWPEAAGWPDDVGQTVIFRFGYLDCFSPAHLQRLAAWQAKGAVFLNPPTFFLDSKAVLATLGLPCVRAEITAAAPDALAILDQAIPETLLLQEETLPRITEDKDRWVIKYAGFDGDNQAWGGRSLQIGATHSLASWRSILRHCLDLPWPVVAQRAVPSRQVDIAYVDAGDSVRMMGNGRTRLRTFMLRDKAGAVACGSHVTVAAGAMQVSEATDAVQAPVVFR